MSWRPSQFLGVVRGDDSLRQVFRRLGRDRDEGFWVGIFKKGSKEGSHPGDGCTSNLSYATTLRHHYKWSNPRWGFLLYKCFRSLSLEDKLRDKGQAEIRLSDLVRLFPQGLGTGFMLTLVEVPGLRRVWLLLRLTNLYRSTCLGPGLLRITSSFKSSLYLIRRSVLLFDGNPLRKFSYDLWVLSWYSTMGTSPYPWPDVPETLRVYNHRGSLLVTKK